MALLTAPLTLLAFPQRWEPATGEIVVRVLCLPVGDPRAPLLPAATAFGDADLRFEAMQVDSLDHVPRSADAAPGGLLALLRPPLQKAALFDALAQAFDIRPGPPPGRLAAPMNFRKPVPASYRALTGERQLGDEMTDLHAHGCALHEAHAGQPAAPVVLESRLRWGQVIAYALRQPALAEALGLMGELRVPVAAGAFARGGWLWLAPHASGDFAGDLALVAAYAARIPPLDAAVPRTIYAPVLFPVDAGDFVLDDVLRDAERYDDGFARLVHGAQGDAPDLAGAGSRDAIRLAWDDEQVARWFTRQVGADAVATMGTAGFRVDVRLAGGAWASLQRVRSIAPLALGPVDLGDYAGEQIVEVVPTRISPLRAGEFWLPSYFAAWRGASLVLTDPAFARLAQPLPGEGPVDPRHAPLQLGREKVFEAVGDKDVPLRYGRTYDFRVRLADLTGGGPGPGDDTPAPPDVDEHVTASIPFRRHRRPGAVIVTRRPDRAQPSVVIEKPRLGLPELLFASPDDADEDALVDAVRAARRDDAAADVAREPGLPDPDVVAMSLVVEARALAGDGEPWQELYRAQRAFPADTLVLPLAFEDRPTLSDFAPGPQDDDPLPVPTARPLRLRMSALGREDAGYFGSADARLGAEARIEFEIAAGDEAAPFAPHDDPLLAFFFRTPPADGSTPTAVQRLAAELDLVAHGTTLAGRPGRRLVFAASTALRHTLAPDGSSIALASEADVAQRWLVVVQLRVARDWTWRGAGEPAVVVQRRVAVGAAAADAAQVVGTIRLPPAVATGAATGLAPGDARDDGRQFTDVVFLDLIDPKPAHDDGGFPDELHAGYELQAAFSSALVAPPAPLALPELRLPVTTPPTQVPVLVSAGIALSPYGAADDYSSTSARRRMLWLEFAQPVQDPRDSYYVRLLVNAPDPLLTDEVVAETRPEPPLAIDAEWMRLVRPGQPADDSGARALSAFGAAAAEARHFLLPWPDGFDESSSELFDMLTCEIRVGHDGRRWCTAQGRFGPALRAAGLQHPPPPLTCLPARIDDAVRVSAPFATPLLQGRNVRPQQPRTRLWGLLYARVQQADGRAWRNVLLARLPLLQPHPDANAFGQFRFGPEAQPPLQYGEGRVPLADIAAALARLGLAADAPLTAMAVEFHTAPEIADPVGEDLARARMLRASPLVPVPDAC